MCVIMLLLSKVKNAFIVALTTVLNIIDANEIPINLIYDSITLADYQMAVFSWGQIGAVKNRVLIRCFFEGSDACKKLFKKPDRCIFADAG